MRTLPTLRGPDGDRFVDGSRVVRVAAAALSVLLAITGVVLINTTASAANHVVSQVNQQFTPPDMQVAVGDTVTWQNDDTVIHSVMGGPFSNPEMAPGQSFEHTFDEAGTFEYTCRFHPAMMGTVHVGDGGEAPPDEPPTGDNPAPPAEPAPAPGTPPLLPGLPGLPGPTPPADGTERDLGDGNRLMAYEEQNGVKVFRLRAAPIKWETEPGRVRDAFAYNGVIPGPVMRVNEGDDVRVIFENALPEPSAVHWHGMELPNEMDGVPDITQPHVMPGETFFYEFKAVSTGTHWYHSHMGGNQEGKGLYGSLEVVPKLGDVLANRDYRMLIGDGPLGFVFNGKSFPATKPIEAVVGERVRIRLIGTGPELNHPIHLHGGHFDVVAQDGNPLPIPYQADTLIVGVGQTFDIVFTPKRPGKWLLHCHVFSHSELEDGMTGLVTTLDVAPRDPLLPQPEQAPAGRAPEEEAPA